MQAQRKYRLHWKQWLWGIPLGVLAIWQWTLDVAREALNMQGVDELGLDKLDRTMLLTAMDKFGGGPVGLDTLSAMTGEDATTIEDVYEPYLMQLGFMMRTPRGRVVTPAAYEHMGRKPQQPADDGQEQMRI